LIDTGFAVVAFGVGQIVRLSVLTLTMFNANHSATMLP